MTLQHLRIDRLAPGGSGVGRLDSGKICFVPYTAPGDRLRMRVVNEHRSWLEGELVELLEPSPQRVQPRCPVFGQCGGCDWQHLSYPAQAEAKRLILLESLQRVGKLADPPVGRTVAAPSPYGYRARAQFKLHRTPDGLKAGFYRRGSRFVIDLPEGCPVVTPAVNEAMKRLQHLLDMVPDANRIPQVSLEEGLRGVAVIVHYIGAEPRRLADLLLNHQVQLGLHGLCIQTGRKESLTPVFGSSTISYGVPGYGAGCPELELSYQIGGFSQVNRAQNRTMVSLVATACRPDPALRLLDLFCGNGNLSLPMAARLKEVLGAEGFAQSVVSAVDNAGQLRVNNSTFMCLDAAAAVDRLTASGTVIDLVVLDPPRTGAVEAVRRLDRLRPQRIVYVSCDPATMARDLAILCGGSGYRLIEATPLDMFPQTCHLETVALLSRYG